MAKKRPGTIYGRRLREARESRGFSQTGLGIAVGLDESGAGSLISRYENGIHQPKLGRQELFARALELPLTYFYTEDDEAARLIANAARSDKPARRLVEIKGRMKRK
ncbi:transcriptional regulator [Pseudoxanthomonas yeongjuensis]|jgi:transcriptional regulator with XRE-family HTH domain|uniref:helix-turn-helix domain-containing protein n=1 Tax=Pseudoxanthomonas yeongjuensis TaxID=377616 RepID=UPI0013913F85|nr:helix-turn-helix transcriptional regulator [Pseudoxanthomonas yeongjuensis]KAF1716848.1 transcriptional regulator [Pseudoxanthomonas yeongjuensis]